MTRAEKLAQIAETEQKVYDKGYEEGFKKGKENTDTNVIENVEISLDFSNGDQTERLPEGYSANSVTIFQPETLVPKNIAKGVNIAGIIGTHEGGGSIEGVATVTFCNYDGTELYSRPVFIGDDCPEPVAQGKINTPTKESDVQYNYTFNGWSDTLGGSASSTALKNITADKTVYAGYATSLVYYTVRFYDGDALMQESQVAYGGTVIPPSTAKEGFFFKGWTPSELTIYGDTDFYGEWGLPSTYYLADSITGVSTQWFNGIAVNPEGTIAVFCPRITATDQALVAYDLATLTPIDTGTTLSGNFYPHAAAFSPDGTKFVICGDNGTTNNHGIFYAFDVSEKTFTAVTSGGSISKDNWQDVVFAPDSQSFWLVSYKVAHQYAWGATSYSKSITTGSSSGSSVSYTPDYKYLVITDYSSSKKNGVNLYDVENNYTKVTIFSDSNDNDGTYSATFTQDGSKMVVGTYGEPYARFWSRVALPYTELTSPLNPALDSNYSWCRVRYLLNDARLLVIDSSAPSALLYDATGETYTLDEDFPEIPSATCFGTNPSNDTLVIGCKVEPYVHILRAK